VFREVFNAFLGQHPDAQIVCNALGTVLAEVVLALAMCALYYELRTVKEGDEPDELSAVFD
jgi:hypothetical protein